MISLILLILFMALLFKATGFLFHIAGKILGGIIGIIGWMILAVLAVSLLGLAVFVLPVVIIVGIIALIVAAAG